MNTYNVNNLLTEINELSHLQSKLFDDLSIPQGYYINKKYYENMNNNSIKPINDIFSDNYKLNINLNDYNNSTNNDYIDDDKINNSTNNDYIDDDKINNSTNNDYIDDDKINNLIYLLNINKIKEINNKNDKIEIKTKLLREKKRCKKTCKKKPIIINKRKIITRRRK